MPKSKGATDPEVVALRREVARRIKSALAKKRMKRVDLARAVGVGATTVNSWITGRAAPGAENLVRVSKVLEVSVSFLIPSGFTSRDSIEKKGEELAIRIGPRLLDRLLELPEQRLRRELHGSAGTLEDEAAGLGR